jgi:hypothetical protein
VERFHILVRKTFREILMNCNHVKTEYTGKTRQVPGMAYVPLQGWGETYDSCKALQRGTLFPVLDKPFKGGAGR